VLHVGPLKHVHPYASICIFSLFCMHGFVFNFPSCLCVFFFSPILIVLHLPHVSLFALFGFEKIRKKEKGFVSKYS
jgi:hypothetical protein